MFVLTEKHHDDPYMEPTEVPSRVFHSEEELKKFLVLSNSPIYSYNIYQVDSSDVHVAVLNGKPYKVFNSEATAMKWVKDKKRVYEVVPLKQIDIDISGINLDHYVRDYYGPTRIPC